MRASGPARPRSHSGKKTGLAAIRRAIGTAASGGGAATRTGRRAAIARLDHRPRAAAGNAGPRNTALPFTSVSSAFMSCSAAVGTV